MNNLTIGKLRGLQEISTQNGLVTVLALDQRGSLIESMALDESDPDLYKYIRDFKMETTAALLPVCSAVLLDPEFSAAEAIRAGCIPGQKGLIVATEKTGYVSVPDGRVNEVILGWSLGKAKRMGASAAKLLTYYNPRIPDLVRKQEDFIAQFSLEAGKLDFPLILEPMSYSADRAVPKKSAEFAQLRPDIVKQTAERLGKLGVDMLKLEFPCEITFEKNPAVWQQKCDEITAAAMVPWVLLSAGVDFEFFKQQLVVACKSGASGFVAGRAIWQDATILRGKARTEFLRRTALDRMKELVEIVNQHAHPWPSMLKSEINPVESGWLSNYSDFK